MSVNDIIAAANEGNPAEFQTAVQDELNARIMAQLDDERQKYADTVFARDVEEIDMGQEYDDEDLETEEDIEDEDV